MAVSNCMGYIVVASEGFSNCVGHTLDASSVIEKSKLSSDDIIPLENKSVVRKSIGAW